MRKMAQFTSLVGILSRSAIGNWVTNNDEAFKTCSEKNCTSQETLIQVSDVSPKMRHKFSKVQ